MRWIMTGKSGKDVANPKKTSQELTRACLEHDDSGCLNDSSLRSPGHQTPVTTTKKNQI